MAIKYLCDRCGQEISCPPPNSGTTGRAKFQVSWEVFRAGPNGNGFHESAELCAPCLKQIVLVAMTEWAQT